MSEQGLLAVEEATINWETSIQNSQQVCAGTVSLMATVLQNINTAAGTSYSNFMKQMPTDTSSSKYGAEMSAFQSKLNVLQAQFDILKNGWNTPLQADNQELQSLGSSSQQASQMAVTVSQPNQITSNLLQAQL